MYVVKMPRAKGTPLQNAFERLNAKGILADQEVTCCEGCIGSLVHREGWRGGLYFDAIHTEYAVASGELWLGLVNMIDPFAELDILAELGRGHLHPIMHGNGVLVFLGARDERWLRMLLDDERQQIHEYMADSHRLARLFSVMREEVAKRKRATDVISEALVAWGLRPGGTLYKRRKISFEHQQAMLVTMPSPIF